MAEPTPDRIGLFPDLKNSTLPETLDEAAVAAALGPNYPADTHPWRFYEKILGRTHETLVKFKEWGRPEDFEAYVGTGWYLEQIAHFERLVRYHVSRGESSWAACAGFDLGRAYQEWMIKVVYDEAMQFGVDRRTELAAGAQLRRKRARADRVAQVEKYLMRGQSLNAAYRIVAKGEGSHWKTIERDYLAWRREQKKHPKPSD